MKKHYFTLLISVFLSVGTFAQSWTIYDNTNSNLGLGTYTAVEIDQSGKIWAGSNITGFAFFNGSTWTRFTSTNSDLLHDNVYDIEIDANNNIWVGNYKGISVYNGSTFTSYDSSNTVIPGMSIYTLGKNTNNDIWIASRNGSFGYAGITVYNGSTFTNLSGYPAPIDGAEFADFAFTSSNTAWIATDPGLTKYDGTFTTYPYATTGLWTSRSIAIDGSGNVWAGGFDGLLKYNGSTWTFISNASLGFPSNTFFYDILVDGNILWIGSAQGLLKFSTSSNTILANYNSTNSPLTDNCVVDIEKDASGNLWLATTLGVVKLNPTGTSGIEEDLLSNLTLVYPNPSEGLYNVSLPENYASPVQIEVIDINGKLVYSEQVNHNQFTIDLSGYPDGIYSLNITSTTNVPIRKKLVLN